MHNLSKMKKPKSLRPPITIVRPTKTDKDAQFELELCWCIQHLETALNSGKLSSKVAEDTMKNLKILKGTNAPLIKKRQVMKAAMGDYRTKMKEEEKKMYLAPKQVKFTPTAESIKKSNFVKKSAILTSGKNFKFNFDTTSLTGNETKEGAVKTSENTKSNTFRFISGVGFKFNFTLDKENDEIKFNELSIN